MSVDAPLVSVIVPVFNGIRFLGEALDAVAVQTHPRVEVIVVDDASTDGSAELAEAHDGVRVIRLNENGGPAAARNAGIDVARGELIALADADDVMYPDKLEKQVAHLRQHPEIDVLMARHHTIYDDGAENRPARARDGVFGDVGGVEFGTALVRAPVFAVAGGFDPAFRYGEGLEWLTRVRRAGLEVAVLPERLIARRLHADNLSHHLDELQSSATGALRRRIAEQRRADPSQ